jgi:ATP-dependent DNA ligase
MNICENFGNRRLRPRRQGLDGIYLGCRKGKDLIYAGKVDHGFDKVSVAELRKRLIHETEPYAKRIAHEGIWAEPELLAEIEYRAMSAEGKVRQGFAGRPMTEHHCGVGKLPLRLPAARRAGYWRVQVLRQ